MPEVEDKSSYPDIENMCRLCLKEQLDSDEVYKVFAENDLSIPMKFIQCVSIEAKISDGLPKIICVDCRYELEKSFLFRQRSLVSDKKLRKHLRLLTMGKTSRVFEKSQEQDDYDDEELDFEDSVSFIKEHDEKRENAAEKWREKFEEEQQLEMNKCLAEAKLGLRDEVRLELAEEVRHEVWEQVRQEVQEEYRNEQMAKLLGELEIFLVEKKAGLWETLRPSNTHSDPATKLVAGLPQDHDPLNEDELLPSSPIRMDVEDENDASPSHAFPDIKMVETGDVVSTRDGEIYIINSNVNEEVAKSVEEFEPDNRITSYNIKDNGDIQFSGEKPNEMDDVMVFDLNDDIEGEVEDEQEQEQQQQQQELEQPQQELEQQEVFKFQENVVIVPKKEKASVLPPLSKRTRSNDFVCKRTPELQAPQIGRATDTVKTFQCEKCPVAFATQKLLMRHSSAHFKTLKKGKSGTLKCPTCHLQLSCSSSLKRHMIIHTGLKPYKCDECDLSFSQREVLKRHKDTHTGVKRHQCPSCNSCFAQKSNMQQHISRVHMDNSRSHQCHLCERSFNHLSGLSRHLVTHSGVVFSCKECGRQFNDRSAVQRHVQTVHKITKKLIEAGEINLKSE